MDYFDADMTSELIIFFSIKNKILSFFLVDFGHMITLVSLSHHEHTGINYRYFMV